MRSRAESALRLATAGLVAAGYAALAATPLYNGLMLVIPLLVLPLVRMGERLDASYSAYRRLTTALDVLFLFVLPVSFVVVGLYDTVVILRDLHSVAPYCFIARRSGTITTFF